jgi:hypothetical protein
MLGGALLLAGNRVAGLDQLNQMRGPITIAYHAVCTVVADLGRDDVFRVLVNWRGGAAAISEVAAGYLLRLLLSWPRPAHIRTTVRRIWNNDRTRIVAVRALTVALQAWIDDPSVERPPLQIVSYLEVLLALGAGAGSAPPLRSSSPSPPDRRRPERCLPVTPRSAASPLTSPERPRADTRPGAEAQSAAYVRKPGRSPSIAEEHFQVGDVSLHTFSVSLGAAGSDGGCVEVGDASPGNHEDGAGQRPERSGCDCRPRTRSRWEVESISTGAQ